MEGSNNKVAIWIVVIIIVIAGIGLIARGKSDTVQEATGEPIKIGFIGPLTGDASSLGTVARAAVEVAVKEINDVGGANGDLVQVVYEDGECNGVAGTNAAKKLIESDKVDAIIGGLCSSETAAFAPAAMAAKVVTMSYCSSAPNLSNTGKYFFRDYPSDAFQGKFAAEYAYNTIGARKVAILYSISDWGTGIKDVFTSRFLELGGEIIATEGGPQDSRDYRTPLSKIKGLKPDLIYIPMYPEAGIAALGQAKDLGITTKMLGGDAWSDTKLQKEITGLSNIWYIEAKTGSPEDFNAKILAATGGEQVSICAAQAYDAAFIVIKAIEEVGKDPDMLADKIRSTNYDGVSGHIEFDANGDVTVANYVVKKIENGTATLVQ